MEKWSKIKQIKENSELRWKQQKFKRNIIDILQYPEAELNESKAHA